MKISFECTRETLTAHLNGELDQHSAGDVRKAVEAELKQHRTIKLLVLELSGVGFMDSSGIGLILGRYRQMRDAGGKLTITNAQPQVEKLLKLSGIIALLEKQRRGRANG